MKHGIWLIGATGAVLLGLVIFARPPGKSPKRDASPPSAPASSAAIPANAAPAPPSLRTLAGKWRIDSREASLNCGGEVKTPPSTTPGGEVELKPTVDGRLEVTVSANCRTLYTVAGSTATAIVGQRCEDRNDRVTSVTEVVKGTFTSADGKKAEAESEYRAKMTYAANGNDVECVGKGKLKLSRLN